VTTVRAVFVVAAVCLLGLGWPVTVLGHTLGRRAAAPLPLTIYLVGAAIAVGLSFAFVVVRDIRAKEPRQGLRAVAPCSLVLLLRAVGLLGWSWVATRTALGGSNGTDVSTLVLWVYGWVGLALASALVGPVWAWLDPFATLYDLGAAVARRLHLRPWHPARYPRPLVGWPAVAGMAVFAWLELAYAGGGIGILLLAYSGLTLLGMARFGRDAWRAQGETFSVWFTTLGRLAPYALEGLPASRMLTRRPALAGLITGPWSTPLVVLTALATGSILYDGLSQTQPWHNAFGSPTLPIATLHMGTFLGLIVAATLFVGRVVGLAATGAGLLPIALGYLLAHYLTYLLGEGQRILSLISDPLGLGWDLFGTATYQPSTTWIQSSLVWSFQLIAVIGGHVVGAWAGHVVAARSTPGLRRHRLGQVPLALVMVALTTTTLWSLGQAAAA
jgi:hypothetical protein